MPTFIQQALGFLDSLADQLGIGPEVPFRGWIFLGAGVLLGVGVLLALTQVLANARITEPVRKRQKAELLMKRKEYAEAKEVFRSANIMGRAAQAAYLEGDLENAAKWALEAKEHALAGQALATLGRPAESAKAYDQGRKTLEAAEQWLKKSGDLEAALARFQQIGHNRRAQELLERLGRYVDLAPSLEQELAKLKSLQGENPSIREVEQARQLADRTAVAYQKSGNFQKAYEVYLKVGMTQQAASCLEKLGQKEKAADLYREAENIEDAARVLTEAGQYERAVDLYHEMGRADEIPGLLRKAGQGKEARAIEARLAKGKGDLIKAASLLEESEEFREAAELYDEFGQYKKAAELWQKVGCYEEAAGAFERAGNLEQAASLYALGGSHAHSARCYEKLKKFENAEVQYAQAGAFFEAGLLAERLSESDRAIAHLQKVTKDSAQYGSALHILSRALWKKGLKDLALKQFTEICGGKEPAKETIELFYDYAVFLEELGEIEKAGELYGKILVLNFHYKDALDRKRTVDARKPTQKPKSEKSYHPRPGSTFAGRYRLDRQIGSGGMGLVFCGEDEKLGRKVALKFLPPSVVSDPQTEKRFLTEARMAAQLTHPNIVAFYDAGREGETSFLVMEYVDGKDLKQQLEEEHPFSIAQSQDYARQLATGLAFAHSRKIVHRDIKPGNILITKDQKLKIADFGLARALESLQRTTTQTIGSPLYMAPEQIRGDKYDHRVDLYALGIVIYEMLAGAPPFTEGEVVYHHLHTEPKPLSELRSDAPVEVVNAVMKLLKKSPAERFNSANEFLDVLEGRSTLP